MVDTPSRETTESRSTPQAARHAPDAPSSFNDFEDDIPF